tara:strand:+ start:15830 stop:16495 length:666 start_codon:yes stop_codon:yes gene_type:complete
MYPYLKRFFDFFSSLIVLIILSPLLVPIVLVLKFSAEGEVFYLQERVGYKKKNFSIMKFATMLKNSENIGSGTITLRNDFRVTKPGKFLRKTKINELPQLVNILFGDISVVGPRPLLKESFESYPAHVQKKIYFSKPGLTGIGSIVFRDEEDILSSLNDKDPHVFYNTVIAPYKGELELWYLKNKSFLTDFKLILVTAWVIFFPKSKIYQKLFKNLPHRNF